MCAVRLCTSARQNPTHPAAQRTITFGSTPPTGYIAFLGLCVVRRMHLISDERQPELQKHPPSFFKVPINFLFFFIFLQPAA